MSKKVKIGLIGGAAVIAIIIILAAALGGGSGGGVSGNYYYISTDKIPAISYALGENRKIQSSNTSLQNSVTILRVDYKVPGTAQGMDLRAYFDYLCNNDGFSMRTAGGDLFGQSAGSSIQAWRNSVMEGHMVVVQADYDTKGYTITVMHGQGQAGGGAP